MTVMSTTNGEWKGIGALERPRYFPRQLITPEEMNLEVRYHRDMMRRHNRMLHGWGVVAGAEVCMVAKKDGSGNEPYMLRVSPGYLLGPGGDEIVIARERVFDVRMGTVTGCSDDLTTDMSDAWCTTVAVQKIPDTFYLAVRYKEILSRQVRAQPAACGCDDTPCEYSRICDGYEFCVHANCPEVEGAVDTPEELLQSLFRSYTDHPEEIDGSPLKGWVTLAKVTLDPNGNVQGIDNCSCRRMVATFAEVWSHCEAAKEMFTVDEVKAELYPDAVGKMVIVGSNLREKMNITLPGDFKITSDPVVKGDGSEMYLEVYVDKIVTPGEYTITLEIPGSGSVSCKFTVSPSR